jgi:hypothetical protein
VPKRSCVPAPVAVAPIVELAAALVPPVTVTPAALGTVALVPAPPEMVELVPAAPVAAGADALKKATDGCNQVAVEIMAGNCVRVKVGACTSRA